MRLEDLLEAASAKPPKKTQGQLHDELTRAEATALGQKHDPDDRALSPEEQYEADSLAPGVAAKNFAGQPSSPSTTVTPLQQPVVVNLGAKTAAGPVV